ncbi:MAG: hypothetical protein EZS28_049723, partial [Streblomastix strix]
LKINQIKDKIQRDKEQREKEQMKKLQRDKEQREKDIKEKYQREKDQKDKESKERQQKLKEQLERMQKEIEQREKYEQEKEQKELEDKEKQQQMSQVQLVDEIESPLFFTSPDSFLSINIGYDELHYSPYPAIYDDQDEQNQQRRQEQYRFNYNTPPRQYPNILTEEQQQQIISQIQFGIVIEKRRKINQDGSVGSIFGICSICQEQIVVGDEITIIADCLHPYHKACILPWFESKLFGKRREEVNLFCPNCRYQIKSLVLRTIAPA